MQAYVYIILGGAWGEGEVRRNLEGGAGPMPLHYVTRNG